MKKICFTITILVMCIFLNSFKAKANNDQSTYLNNFACHYYSNLDNNYIVNESQNYCSFQSFGHLLMYWDTYWDDGFINDTHNVEEIAVGNSLNELSNISSPGIKNFIYGYDLTIDENSNEFLPMANNIYGLIEMNSSPYKSMLSCLADVYEKNGLSFNDVLLNGEQFKVVYDNLISKYFDSDYCAFNEEYFYSNYNTYYQYSSDILTWDDYRDEVISYVSQGFPVMIGLYDNINGALGKGHCCIAYDYDAITGKLFVFTDVLVNNNQVELFNHYEIPNNMIIADYYVICPKNYQSHVHSYNYFVYNEETNDYNGYCHCELSIHEHNIIQEYPNVFNASICYRVKCYCGLNEVYSHDYYVEGNKHYCSICGSNGKHMGLFVPNNNYTCRGTCEICLFSVTISHEWQQNGTIKNCRLCGRYTTVETPILNKKEEEENE